MTRTATATAVKRIISKGLTGWQAGKLILQDMIDSYLLGAAFGRNQRRIECEVSSSRSYCV